MTSPRQAGIRKYLLCLLLVPAVVLLFFGGCTKATDSWGEIPGTGPNVLVTFPPLYCFVKNVAGDHAKVMCLLTDREPHDYSPSAADALKAKKAALFIINGLDLDEYVLRIRDSSGNKKSSVLDIGEVLEKHHDELLIHIQEAGGHDHSDPHHHHGGEHDPHVWLGIKQAKVMVQIIAEKLSEVSPEHKADFHKNAENYLKKLDELHKYGQKQFAAKQNKRVIATHDSMRYFAESFGLKIVDNLMPQPGVQADAKKLQELIKLCTDKNAPVQVITTEPQYGEKTAETLMAQIKKELESPKRKMEKLTPPTLVTFDTMETAVDPHFNADYYYEKMKQNIDNLAKAFK